MWPMEKIWLNSKSYLAQIMIQTLGVFTVKLGDEQWYCDSVD